MMYWSETSSQSSLLQENFLARQRWAASAGVADDQVVGVFQLRIDEEHGVMVVAKGGGERPDCRPDASNPEGQTLLVSFFAASLASNDPCVRLSPCRGSDERFQVS